MVFGAVLALVNDFHQAEDVAAAGVVEVQSV
jgi:hypothetical protein